MAKRDAKLMRLVDEINGSQQIDSKLNVTFLDEKVLPKVEIEFDQTRLQEVNSENKKLLKKRLSHSGSNKCSNYENDHQFIEEECKEAWNKKKQKTKDSEQIKSGPGDNQQFTHDQRIEIIYL